MLTIINVLELPPARYRIIGYCSHLKELQGMERNPQHKENIFRAKRRGTRTGKEKHLPSESASILVRNEFS